MAAIAIRLELQQYRPLAGAYPFKRGFCRTAYSENVHSVHLNTRNTKAFAPPVKLVLGGGAIDRSAHGVLIILHHDDDRQLPKLDRKSVVEGKNWPVRVESVVSRA